MKWQYGITTVPSRFETTLPQTIQSLFLAGFDNPWLFCDGGIPKVPRLRFVARSSPIGIVGNWMSSLWTLYGENPLADRYAIFQDDIIATTNLRQYLEKVPLPNDQYWNLFSFMKDNEKLLNPGNYGKFLRASQYGRGAVALVFPRSAVVKLLSSNLLAMKPQSANKRMATKKIDGGIVTALSPTWKQARSHTEMIHNPSLVQHQKGHPSSLGNGEQPYAKTFPGEDFDCLSLLERKSNGESEAATTTTAG